MQTTEHTVTHPSSRSSGSSKLIVTIVLLVIVGAGGFVGGRQYQKSNSTTSTTNVSSFQAGNGQRSGGFAGNSMGGGPGATGTSTPTPAH